MELVTPKNKINEQHFINKEAKENLLAKQDTIKVDDKNKGSHIKPYIPVGICDNLIYQNVLLEDCISTLAEDTVLNDFNLLNTNESDDAKVELIKQFWQLNQDELLKQIKDYFSYGFGASEITFNDDLTPKEIAQIQADTLYIRKETYKNEFGESTILYYAVQQINGVDNVKMRLLDRLEEYPEKDNNLNICLWIGGGRKSSFYDYPCWITCFNHVSASVSLDMLDADKLANGNLIAGILTIIRPPINPQLEETVEDTLEEKMEAKGSGVFTLELNTLNPDIPLTVDYIKISEDNYQYLNELSEKSDKKILACFKIPKVRLLIDDSSESMNSHKTKTLYKIYAKELNNKQRPLENIIRKFNLLFYELDAKVEIDTPVFVDDKDIETDITLKLFNNGLITLGQALKKIESLFPELTDYLDIPIEYTNPIYNERYYNGKPLGFNEEEMSNPVENVGDLIEYAQINEVLSKQDQNR